MGHMDVHQGTLQGPGGSGDLTRSSPRTGSHEQVENLQVAAPLLASIPEENDANEFHDVVLD